MSDAYQYYPTPPSLALKAWGKFKNRSFVRVLEPEAGSAHLAELAPDGRHGKPPIDCVEIDLAKHPILRSKGFQVVGVDFMQFQSGSIYSHIIMNPPFAEGAKHVLKAWDVLEDGEIVAILNAETVRNPYSKERQHLANLIGRHGEVEFCTDTFNGEDAERKTDVEVALVWLKKESNFNEELVGSILSNLSTDGLDADGLATGYHDFKEVALPNSFIENSVKAFDAAVEATRQAVMASARAMHYTRMLGETLEVLNGQVPKANFENSREWVKRQLYEKYKDLKDRAWTGILRSTDVTSRLSSRAQRRIEKEFEAIKHLEFTVPNVYGFLQGIIRQQGDIQIGMVCDVFDLTTRYHTDNTVYYMGWKSNDKHRTLGMRIKTTRFIIPGHRTESWQRGLDWNSEQMLRDFDKVFAMLDGKLRPDVSLESVFREHFQALRVGTRMSSSYFDVRYYPGIGTIHFFPRDKKLIDRLNRWVGRHRQWLPPEHTHVSQAFWLQYERAEKFDKEFRSEVKKRRGRQTYRDPFWDASRGVDDESHRAIELLVDAMSTTLGRHGIDPDGLLDDVQPMRLVGF